MEIIRDRTTNQTAQAQTIFELRRELYKVQAEKKSLELEKEFLEQNYQQQRDNTHILRELNEKENELYELKIKAVQKDNDLLALNQRIPQLERQL